MIAVVDSGVANLTSVMAALRRLGAEAEVTADPAVIARAAKVILPGVGAAAAAMEKLKARGLVEPLRALTQPVLGICLGMQLLFTESEEGSEQGAKPTACLDIIPGRIERLPSSPSSPVPHMGWNQLDLCVRQHPLLRGIGNECYVYFVHSFAAPEGKTTLARTKYGANFSSMVGHLNFLGCQFHPERSGAIGSRILRNFLEL